MSQAAPKVSLPRPRSAAEIVRQPINALVYGEPGVGKTTFAATGPGPVLFFDVDGGLRSLTDTGAPARKTLLKELAIDPQQIYFYPIRSLKDLFHHIEGVKHEFTLEPNRYGTIVLDTITELQRVLLDDIMAAQKRSTPTQQDWGIILLQVQKIVRVLKSFPCHMICLAHEQNKEGRILPSLSGKIQEEVPGYFDEVWRFTATETEKVDAQGQRTTKILRMVRCGTNPGWMIKTRTSYDEWERPHLGQMIQKAFQNR